MLVNGKQVGHLILGGETFTSENMFPAYYDFPKISHDKSYPTYDISSFDKTGVKFERSHITSDANFDFGPLSVYKQILSADDKYLLVKSLDTMVVSPTSDNPAAWVRGLALWFKLSDLGGEMIPATGGVNSPSYILFIFNVKGATPHVS